jgi:ubiquinone/menaquinone biosynthesis C-methylase UbiE
MTADAMTGTATIWRAAVAAGLLAGLLACSRPQQEASDVAPAPPAAYGQDEANYEVWLDTMEMGGRELYAAREAVIAAVGLDAGLRVVDIGAGTGLYTLLFAEKVGPTGVVYAVDIEPRFLKLISQRAVDLDFRNVVTVLSRPEDITLPAGSVDIAYIADTYHYFEDREAIMASVRDALAPSGRLIVIDYTLDEADKGDPKREHVRFGKAGLVNEIESFGFRLVDDPSVPGLKDFYAIIFQKAPDAGPETGQGEQ